MLTSLLTNCAKPPAASVAPDRVIAPPAYTGFRPLGNQALMNDPALWGELNVHDPAIIKDGDWYYVFSTDASLGNVHQVGVQVRRSPDLITWQHVGTAFADAATDATEAIAYAKLDPQKKQGFWAPDIIKEGNVFRLYFAASTFGSSRSCIALAESPSPLGPYQYKGIVVTSEANAVTKPNAIDPALVRDSEGNPYMAYGSFFGGIFLVKLDQQSGFIDESVAPVRIAGYRGAAIEAPCIVYLAESGYYYLFVSYGSLSRDYNIRVGRSRVISGPYLDANGNDLATLAVGNENTVGTKLMGGYTFTADDAVPAPAGYKAPGHNSALIDGSDYFLVHHVRAYTLPDYWFSMNIRRFYLNRFGWPVVAPLRFHGESADAISDGDYALVSHGTDSNADAHVSQRVTLRDGVISGMASGAASGGYRFYDGYRIELELNGTRYDGVTLRQYDGERDAEVYTFTAMSESGLCIWGVSK
jgi:arabinan endo-1,5-alpha-L-arabinosidase